MNGYLMVKLDHYNRNLDFGFILFGFQTPMRIIFGFEKYEYEYYLV